MRNDRRLLTGFLGFFLLGMPLAALGVAWPSMSDDLGRPLGDLGIVLVATTVGYVAATAFNGLLTHRFGTGAVLPVAGGFATAGIMLWAIAGTLSWVVVAAVVLGAAGGAVDAGVNAYVAVSGTTSSMGWLHAMFGLGSTVGPLLATLIISSGGSWRLAFWVLAAGQLAVAGVFAATRHSWAAPPTRRESRPHIPRHLWPVLALGLVAFGFYTGAEVAAGEWSYSLFTEGRAMGVRTAGFLVTGYWAALTLGRVAMGMAGDRISPPALLMLSLAGAGAGSVFVWWDPMTGADAAGLLVMGLFLAPVFPVLVLLTSRAVGERHTPGAVGYQIAAAGIGSALIPGVIGALVGTGGIGVVGPVIAAATGILLAAGLGFVATTARRAAAV